MDQLVVLQEIYASFSRGGDGLKEIDSKAIEGSCPELIAKLLESSKKAGIDEDVCRKLSSSLQDVYEIKRLGDICRSIGMHSLAISTYNRALSLCRDQVLRPVLQNNLGQAYARQGDLARAAFYYQKSAGSFEKTGDSIGLAHVLGNLGSAYRRNRDWEKAIEHCYRSLKTFEEKSDDLGIAQMTGSLGRIYADMGERELAARYFERSLTDFQRLGDKKSAAWVLDRLGRIAGERSEWDRAQDYYNQSLSLFEQQDQSQSRGIVLSNLGRMYLKMGEASAARESLEKAILLIRRNMQPGYQNALSCLAATYSTLAKNGLQEAEDSEELGRGSARAQRLEASKHFARSSDRFLELASALPGVQAEIKVKAGIARSRSYLARLSGYVSDEEAVALADRALASLDTAAANAEESKKARIQSLAGIISGMKEARSIGLLGSEPWRLTKAVTNACEYLMGGARECIDGDISSNLSSGLRNFMASIDAERSRMDPAERLYAAAESIRGAGKHFSAAEKDPKERNARKLIEAAAILEGQASRENRYGQDELRHNQLCFGPERDALLLIAEAMANNLLAEIDDTTTVFTWDETLNLIPDAANCTGVDKIKIDELEAELEQDKDLNLETDLPDLEVSEERSFAQDMILADDTFESSEFFVSEIVNPEECWLVPVAASAPCKSYGQIILPPRQVYNSRTAKPLEPEDEVEEANEEVNDGLLEELGDHDYLTESHEPQETGFEDAGPVVREAVPDIMDAPADDSFGPFSRAKAILLIKALAVLVVLLLAIETILYLI